MSTTRDYKISLTEHYRKSAVPAMQHEFGFTNALAVPKILKVVVNVGLGQQGKEGKIAEVAVKTLSRITGQKPVLTRAKKSISNFKIRQGMVIGAVVTLRGKLMYDFLEKLIRVTLPRVRDFRGLSVKSVDAQGNLAIGFKEHLIFPEIRSDEVEAIHGLEIAITTNAKNRERGRKLFEFLGFPFAN
ncbi:MAG: 50S ribosomal protein L5 [Parcubacteria group bacterium GW2011_GWD2_43_10]|uniref:Large ribosomal subunit protein uL5 n=5 Tax=Candidatus Vebleniibacteriota TaxID=1817921 RepID=A0A1G2Q5K5_9BACT|nr:MAG: 50S ribosomal protein L5 [Parcubacteria group bacterium GW2011_GWA2_42_80]KKS78565.1 MAG: 50S ribosomal protein L5 [Parcubacteria group bacterium GW2011_GWD1_42_9]KKS83201.1 MAG: 50S ribosomal protein L5 [Parcubacteria group bacterium GW2011_GWD2_43_10]KKS92886.1 MAG: 50S ribosomal protein L5 [Parcubacteria group bacterium GW2011_GWE2_43_12]KKT13431.1 MAG: 50S ribosomal protein L5 [Parcubacteria group bacterium GW2011_GWA1_43_27]KKT14969.1 MAG: 50S ribosomal protein L5 [Parcubacteria g